MTACPILIVDDDPSIRVIVAEILADEGYSVGAATNGVEALALVERTVPAFAVLLLDMRMPVRDGWGVARVGLLV